MEDNTQGTPLVTPEENEDTSILATELRVPSQAEVDAQAPPEEKIDEDEELEEIEQPEDFEIPVEAEDPGDYVAQDYSFEVTVFNEDGKSGRRRIINSIDEWENLLDEDPNLGSAAALLKAQRLATKMESYQERDKSAYDQKKTAFEQARTIQVERETEIKNLANEIQYLVTKGKLPVIANKYKNADWSDKEVAKQPGVKEQVALLRYMDKENGERKKLNLSPMSVVDAFNAMQLETNEQEQTEAAKRSANARKAAGARVAGTSAPLVSVAPKGISIGRGGSLNDLSAGW